MRSVIFPMQNASCRFIFFVHGDDGCNKARKTRHWFVQCARLWTTYWKLIKQLHMLSINWLEKIKRLHINSVLTQVVEMKIEKSTWFGSTVRCYAPLSFRFSLPIINSRCILMCEIMHKWDGYSCSIFVLTVWRHLFQGAKAFTARQKSSFFPLFSLQVLWEKIFRNPLRSSFPKITVDIPARQETRRSYAHVTELVTRAILPASKAYDYFPSLWISLICRLLSCG